MRTEYLNRNISLQLKANSTSVEKELTIGNALRLIQSNTYKQITTELRNHLVNGEKEKYKKGKQKLNAVTFSGTFQPTRKKSNIYSYTRILILDIDDLASSEITRIKKELLEDPHILALWISPSGKGIKALMPFAPHDSVNKANVDINHKHAFDYILEYLYTNYNIQLDKSGSDTSRLCYLSHDADIFISGNCKELDIPEIYLVEKDHERKENEKKEKVIISKKSNRDILYNPMFRNVPWNRYTIGSILRYLTNRNLSITTSYDDWLRVAFAISNSFTYDIGLKYFLQLSRLDSHKYNEENCKQFLNECYHSRKGDIGFNTILFLAQQKEYSIARKRKVSSEAVLP